MNMSALCVANILSIAHQHFEAPEWQRGINERIYEITQLERKGGLLEAEMNLLEQLSADHDIDNRTPEQENAFKMITGLHLHAAIAWTSVIYEINGKRAKLFPLLGTQERLKDAMRCLAGENLQIVIN
jgi:hypothetical protein